MVGPDGGRVWFEAHQFRHTVGTSLINNGVPQHLVQRFLGHESREMTNTWSALNHSPGRSVTAVGRLDRRAAACRRQDRF
jgi:integrase